MAESSYAWSVCSKALLIGLLLTIVAVLEVYHAVKRNEHSFSFHHPNNGVVIGNDKLWFRKKASHPASDNKNHNGFVQKTHQNKNGKKGQPKQNGKKSQPQQHPIIDDSSQSADPCSCETPLAIALFVSSPLSCCHRAMASVHKMGYTLTKEIKWKMNKWLGLPNVDAVHGDMNQSGNATISVQYRTIEQGRRHKDRNEDYHVLTEQAQRSWARPLEMNTINTTTNTINTTMVDFRTVIVTRHFYDTILSGYLYHRAGRECWIDPYNETIRGYYWLIHFDWQAFLSNAMRETANTTHGGDVNHPQQQQQQPYWRNSTIWLETLTQIPPERSDHYDYYHTTVDHETYWQRRRSCLCYYLNQTPPAQGLRVFAQFAWEMWLKPTWRLHQLEQASQRQAQLLQEQPKQKNTQQQGRFSFVCYETLNRPERYQETFEQMSQFLFPSTTAKQQQTSSSFANSHDATKISNNDKRAHDHTTSSNQTLKQELYRTLQYLDENYLQGQIGKASSEFGCSSSIVPSQSAKSGHGS